MNSASARARTRGSMIACRPAKIWIVTRMPPPKPSTIGLRTMFPKIAVVPIGFSQGGLLAIQLLRVHPERYAASISLSGFLAPGIVAGSAPADSRIAELNIPVFYGYGKNDTVIPMPEIFATTAWLDEHTFLTSKSYRGLDHAVSLNEFSDLRDWLAAHNIAPGIL